VSIDSAQRTGAGVFGEASVQPAGWLGLTAGLRGDAVRSTNTGGHFGDVSVSNAAVAGLGAVTIAPAAGLTLVAQVARGFRDPALSDRFYRGPVGRGFIEGNPQLRPETSLQFDVTARYAAGPLRLTAAGYRYRISNLVERYAAGSTLFLFRNRGRGDLSGAEVEAQLALPSGFGLAGSVEASRGRDPHDGTPLDDVAPASASITLRYAAGTRVTTYLRTERVAARDAAGPSEVPTREHARLDAGAKWRVGPHLSLLASAGNLLNARYESSAGPRWVLSPGRHGSVSVVVRLPVASR
jgi:outer membrane receptor protein involved in Fe transport